ncbi:BZ3500_MvSof-1268-A1-R1_Chr7-3g09612 [Microbotryum saponariae]|uniref:BZ3500_MvSof-1268-A1-R1_Chr7-3g09612 protein n=1 Tax=Microbotryum saponariae TaxID=289078 RepID=A0A2X0N562_9BASI|nr:BZ3501_MvSof-1269-A2-R1_Chr7-2g09335 [Microbotryum saponariae]SDA02282.1 BZ3500_MvSof-1268-A1-R1_Chr7-3g09612 [Microbotryum saponariae]
MLTLPLLVASLGFSHSVVGSRHKKQDAQQVQASKEPRIDADKMYLIRVNPQIMELQSACIYLSGRCETHVGPNLKPDFSCSSAGQPVVPTSPYLWASCLEAATNEKAGRALDVSFNAFAGSKHTTVFLRGDEAIREVEIDQHLLSIESEKWKPAVNHHPRGRSPTTKRHHRQTNHETTGPKTHSGHNGDRPKRHKQEA